MRVAVVSDIHGNLCALEAVLAALEPERPDELWCLGDLVGYGARPNECCSVIEARASICLAGNHDLAVRGTIDLAEFSGDAGAAASWTRSVLSDEAAITTLVLTDEPIVLVGHSHVALQVSMTDELLEGGPSSAGTQLELGSRRWLMNPGSVGQPRDGDPRAAFLLLDLDARTASFHRVDYDIERTQREIREAGLPEALAARLSAGL